MDMTKEQRDARIKIFKSIEGCNSLEQLEACDKMLELYEKSYEKDGIIRYYLDFRKSQFPQEV